VIGRIGTPTASDLVKIAYAQDQAEAELMEGLLATVEVSSVVRRAIGFDVPEFLPAGPRQVLVAAEDIGVARDVLRRDDAGDVHRVTPSGADRQSRLIAGLVIVVAVIALVACLATDVLG
jgi:hypothetical protein